MNNDIRNEVISSGTGPAAPIDYEILTDKERGQIQRWKDIFAAYDAFVGSGANALKPKADVRSAFIEHFNANLPQGAKPLTLSALAAKSAAYNKRGEYALTDGRGKHQNHSAKYTGVIKEMFEKWYLSQEQLSAAQCRAKMRREMKSRGLDESLLPSLRTLQREAEKIPKALILYHRHGQKTFNDKAAPYIKRDYGDLRANDIWVADNHTFDVFVYDPVETRVIRLYLTAFMDAASRKFTGRCVTQNPCADATIMALKNGVEKYGAPKMIYTDNGREFLTHDIGGNGFRRKKKRTEEDAQTFGGRDDGRIENGGRENGENAFKYLPEHHRTILKNLDIDFMTAIPENARAKPIERAFNTLKEQFSKLFNSYTGGSVAEKPERLEGLLKRPDTIETVNAFITFVNAYIDGVYNKQPHTGDGMGGKCPDEVFAALLYEQRKIPQNMLPLMFMRWSRPLTVGKTLSLTLYGQKIDYFNEDLWAAHLGERVFIKYDPENLSNVRVYGLDGKFICVAEMKEKLSFFASKEEISKHQKTNAHAVKVIREYKKLLAVSTADELALFKQEAEENISNISFKLNPKIITPLMGDVTSETGFNETKPRPAGGYTENIIYWGDVLGAMA